MYNNFLHTRSIAVILFLVWNCSLMRDKYQAVDLQFLRGLRTTGQVKAHSTLVLVILIISPISLSSTLLNPVYHHYSIFFGSLLFWVDLALLNGALTS